MFTTFNSFLLCNENAVSDSAFQLCFYSKYPYFAFHKISKPQSCIKFDKRIKNLDLFFRLEICVHITYVM